MSRLIVSERDWTGSAEQCEAIRQFARDYDWSDTQPTIEDPEFAADTIASEFESSGQCADAAIGLLRAELISSAEYENKRRLERAIVLTTARATYSVRFERGSDACTTTGQRTRFSQLSATHSTRIARAPAWLARAAEAAGYELHVLGYTNHRGHGGAVSETLGLRAKVRP